MVESTSPKRVVAGSSPVSPAIQKPLNQIWFKGFYLSLGHVERKHPWDRGVISGWRGCTGIPSLITSLHRHAKFGNSQGPHAMLVIERLKKRKIYDLWVLVEQIRASK
jgi:hypothetical protein